MEYVGPTALWCQISFWLGVTQNLNVFQHKQFIIFAFSCNVFIFNAVPTITVTDKSSRGQTFVKCFKYIIYLLLIPTPEGRYSYSYFKAQKLKPLSHAADIWRSKPQRRTTVTAAQPRTLTGTNWRLIECLSTEHETLALFNFSLRKH